MDKKKEFEAKVKELEDLSFDIIEHNVSETKSVDFGFKIQRDDEIFTMTDFGNIWTWIDQAITDACKRQTCENCKHWYKIDVDINHETCNKEKSFVSGLPTYSHFGCVEFELSPTEGEVK